MKKVIIVTGSMKRGGAERVISTVANYFASEGITVNIVTCLSGDTEYALSPLVRLIDISVSSSNKALDAPRIIRSLHKTIKKEKPDTVFSFMLTINFVTAIACMGLNVRFIPSERNDPAKRSGFWQWAAKMSYLHSTACVMQTKYARDFFCKKVRDKSVIIPNPVTVTDYAAEKKEKVIVTVGRLEKQKNQQMLIAAFCEFHKCYPDYVLKIFGRGSMENELKTEVKALGISDSVLFMGNVTDVHKQIKDASLFVMTSDYEGMSNALLEAMMMGLTCITTRVACAEEIIDDHEDGIIVETGDTYGLIKEMKNLVSDPERMQKYGLLAHKRTIQKFDTKNILESWKKLV